MAANILDKIRDAVLAGLPAKKRAQPARVLEDRCRGLPKTRDFHRALSLGAPLSLIAEAKKTSPSRGLLRADYDPALLATSYESAGAAALSVLTEEDFFLGHPSHLEAARGACSLPVLRKDFILDPWQLLESRALGADAVLLIVRCLDDGRLRDFLALASELGLAALVETHDRSELDRAQKAGAEIIGVNNRDLTSFRVDITTTLDMAPHVDAGRLLVSESGIRTGEEALRLAKAGVRAILVGEAILGAEDPRAKIQELLNRK